MISTINRLIIFLIISNLFIVSSAGFVAPILSVFIVKDIAGGSLAMIGIATAIYWLVKSILQLFIGRWLDKTPGEKDDLWVLVIGNFIAGLAAFLYLLAQNALHIYLIQLVLAVSGALIVPSWSAMFSRHLDKFREAFEWSLNSSVAYGLGAGVAGLIGGIIAQIFGFEMVFVLSGFVGIASAIVLVPVHKYLERTQGQQKTEIKNLLS